MSLDYPYYQELCRQKHRAAWWWLIGDSLYYLGLLPAMLAVPGAGLALGAGLFGFGWNWLFAAFGIFFGGVVVWFVGASFKGHAYVLGKRDGISAAEVYKRGSRPPR